MQLDALRRVGVPEDNLGWETKSGVNAKRHRQPPTVHES